MSAAIWFGCMTSTSSGVEPSLASHYITRQQLITDGWTENHSASGLISHKICSVLFTQKVPKELKDPLIQVQSMVLSQPHTERGAAERINQTVHNTERLSDAPDSPTNHCVY